MKVDSSAVARLRAALDKSHALTLLLKAIAAPSVAGDVAAFAALLKNELISIGAEDVVSREFAAGRPNVWGLRRGARRDDTLLMIGHSDAVRVGAGGSARTARTRRPVRRAPSSTAPFRSRSQQSQGRALRDDRSSPHARSRRHSAGPNFLFAFVGDEESGEPGTASARARGTSRRHSLWRTPKPVWRSSSSPPCLSYVAHMGFFLCDIKVIGGSACFGVPEPGVDALKAAHPVLAALWRHAMN